MTDLMTELMTDLLRVTVFDYGAGNLHSLVKALKTSRTTVRVETDPARAIDATDALILPGVGAFSPAAERLAPGRDRVRDALVRGLPCLGICLGMQLFFDGSDEGPGEGLGVFSGRVTPLRAARVPQIGWNQLEAVSDVVLAAAQLEVAYYANSFVCRPEAIDHECVVAWSEHEGDRYPAAVRRGMLFGTQFHPEKSSAAGVRFVHGFLEIAAAARDRRLSLGEMQ